MKRGRNQLILAALLAATVFYLGSCAEYRKMNPPADADKPGGGGVDNSCYLATAANMLAGAGYGDGASLQARANDIYADLTTQFGIANGGWTDVALSWWLGSANNTWTTNPYTLVTVYGNKSPKNPWENTDGAMFVGNELRRCCLVGLSISWPVAGATVGSGGHAITAWGDDFGKETLTVNPTSVAVTDSDRDAGGNEQEYTYDAYTNPNPGGANEGNGWYMSYSDNHPYIKHIATLCPADDPTDFVLTQKVTGSCQLVLGGSEPATDLHYTASTDVEILSYRTWISWDTKNDPVITESGNPTNSISVDWDLSDNPVPPGTTVTINTEFVLPSWNSMTYSDVHWTFPDSSDGNKAGERLRKFGWNMATAVLPQSDRLPNNVSGGFVIGAMDVTEWNPVDSTKIVYPYRFVHEYSFNQSPEIHILKILSDSNIQISNLRLGNAWNYPASEELWKFSSWLTEMSMPVWDAENKGILIDWKGKVPYPEGENVYEAIPEKGRNTPPNRR